MPGDKEFSQLSLKSEFKLAPVVSTARAFHYQTAKHTRMIPKNE
jgi:hypothetical protein